LIGNGRAVQVVRFHNVTPPSLVAEKDRSLIERSLRQIQVFHSADEVWADSQENLDELDRRRIPNDKCRLMPLAVVPLTRGRLTEKAPGTVRFIFVGRVVPSKGVDQLIEAAGILQRIGEFEFSLDILGQVGDPENRFIENIVRRIGDLDLQDVVYLKGAVTLDALTDAYSISHVFVTASLHEGFCVPVIEGLAAGCVPISYSNSNLKYIHGGLGLLAASETPDALANAMLSVGKTLLQTWSGKPAFLDLASGSMRPEDFDEQAARYVDLFAPDVCARRVVERVQQLTCGEQINGLN
jgi:glycosyltransferase involved in cell wall biosynthesis